MVGGRRTFWNGTFVLQVDGMAQGCNLHGFIDDSPFFYLALEGGIFAAYLEHCYALKFKNQNDINVSKRLSALVNSLFK